MKKMTGMTFLAFLMASTQLWAAIDIENTATLLKVGQGRTYTIPNFNPGNGNKVIVTASAEGNGGPRTITRVTLGDAEMNLAVGYSDSAFQLQYAAIWYLDNPTASGDITITFDGTVNGTAAMALSLSGASPGDPIEIAGADGREIMIDGDAGAIAVAAFIANGGAPVNALEPLNVQVAGESGSSLSAAGIEMLSQSGTHTYTFTGGGSRPAMAAAVFAPMPGVDVPENGSATFDISLTEDPNTGYPYTVSLATADPNVITSGQTGYDLQVSPTTLTFNTRTDVKTVTLTGVDNTALDGDRGYVISLTPDTGNLVASPAAFFAKIIDNDMPAVTLTGADDLAVGEGNVGGHAETDTFTLSVSPAPMPGKDVTIDLAADSNYLIVDPNQVRFTAADNDPMTITVFAVNNDEHDTEPVPYETYSRSITLTVSNADIGALSNPSVLIYENDCGALGYNVFDRDRDCDVDLVDFTAFADSWLNCQFPNLAGACPELP